MHVCGGIYARVHPHAPVSSIRIVPKILWADLQPHSLPVDSACAKEQSLAHYRILGAYNTFFKEKGDPPGFHSLQREFDTYLDTVALSVLKYACKFLLDNDSSEQQHRESIQDYFKAIHQSEMVFCHTDLIFASGLPLDERNRIKFNGFRAASARYVFPDFFKHDGFAQPRKFFQSLWDGSEPRLGRNLAGRALNSLHDQFRKDKGLSYAGAVQSTGGLGHAQQSIPNSQPSAPSGISPGPESISKHQTSPSRPAPSPRIKPDPIP